MNARSSAVALTAGGVVGICSLGVLFGLGGCAGISEGGATEVMFSRRDIQPPLAVKPEGWVMDQREKKLGPPPPGHPKIVGGVVPGWQPEEPGGPFGQRGGGLNWVSIGPDCAGLAAMAPVLVRRPWPLAT